MDERWRPAREKRFGFSVTKACERTRLFWQQKEHSFLGYSWTLWKTCRWISDTLHNYNKVQAQASNLVDYFLEEQTSSLSTPMSPRMLINMKMYSWNVHSTRCWGYRITQLCRNGSNQHTLYPPNGSTYVGRMPHYQLMVTLEGKLRFHCHARKKGWEGLGGGAARQGL